MNAFTNFSHHAFKRLTQRTHLDLNDINYLLDNKAFVNTGSKPGFEREHLVFYSVKDETPFVAIRDRMSGTVVTVLPLNYHDNLAWPISSESQAKARVLAEELPERKKPKTPPNVFYISVGYIDESQYLKYKLVTRFNALNFDSRVDRLLEKNSLDDLLDAAEDSGISKLNVRYILIRLGSKGDPLVLDVEA